MLRLHTSTSLLHRHVSICHRLQNLSQQTSKTTCLRANTLATNQGRTFVSGLVRKSLLQVAQRGKERTSFLRPYQVTQHLENCYSTSGDDGTIVKEMLSTEEQENLNSFEDDFFGPEIADTVQESSAFHHPDPLSDRYNKKVKKARQQDKPRDIERKQYGYIQYTDRQTKKPANSVRGKHRKQQTDLDPRGKFRLDDFLNESGRDRNQHGFTDGPRSFDNRRQGSYGKQQTEQTYRYRDRSKPRIDKNVPANRYQTATDPDFQHLPTGQNRLETRGINDHDPASLPLASSSEELPRRKENRKHQKAHLSDEGTEESGSTAAQYDEDDFDLDRAKEDENFGTIAGDRYKKRWYKRDVDVEEYVDSDEETEKRHQRPPGQSRHTCQWYGNRMKELAREGKLTEAIDMLETRMLKEDRVQPNDYVYNVLIGACGRAGYSQMAFDLFYKMKERGLLPGMVTFTALLNACAESPFHKTNELGNILRVRQEMAKQSIQPNMITYNAMLKAYAKCADLPAALELFQEIVQSGQEVTAKTFSFLLFASTEDREAGFTQTVEAWRLMRKSHINPDIFIYNLLLRAARDCGIGDPDVAEQILLGESDMKGIPRLQRKKKQVGPKLIKGSKGNKQLSPGQGSEVVSKEMLTVEPVGVADMQEDSINQDQTDDWWKEGTQDKVTNREAEVKTVVPTQHAPNLLDLERGTETVVSLGKVQTSADRLDLFGGVEGFLSSMKADGVKPNIKTFCQMVEIIRPSTSEEEALLTAMSDHGVTPDRDFYNALIRKRAMRRDMEAAKAVLPMMSARRQSPNLRTYVNMAMACTNGQEGFKLLREVKQAGLTPNVQLFTALIGAALGSRDFLYVKDLILEMEKLNVAPDEWLIKKLENAAIQDKEPQKGPFRSPMNAYLSKVRAFRGVYQQWLERMPAAQEQHPWDKYRKTPSQEGGAAAS